MKEIYYKFFVNEQKNEDGIHLGFIRGYKEGDKLELAHQGFLTVALSMRSSQICEELFYKYNEQRSPEYRGRSMSVGDVVVLTLPFGDVRYAVGSVGFENIGHLKEVI